MAIYPRRRVPGAPPPYNDPSVLSPLQGDPTATGDQPDDPMGEPGVDVPYSSAPPSPTSLPPRPPTGGPSAPPPVDAGVVAAPPRPGATLPQLSLPESDRLAQLQRMGPGKPGLARKILAGVGAVGAGLASTYHQTVPSSAQLQATRSGVQDLLHPGQPGFGPGAYSAQLARQSALAANERQDTQLAMTEQQRQLSLEQLKSNLAYRNSIEQTRQDQLRRQQLDEDNKPGREEIDPNAPPPAPDRYRSIYVSPVSGKRIGVLSDKALAEAKRKDSQADWTPLDPEVEKWAVGTYGLQPGQKYSPADRTNYRNAFTAATIKPNAGDRFEDQTAARKKFIEDNPQYGIKGDAAMRFVATGQITDPSLLQRRDLLDAMTRLQINQQSAPADPAQVKYWAGQVKDDPRNWQLVQGDKTLSRAVREELAAAGVNVNQLDASDRTAARFAGTALKHINVIKSTIDDLEKNGQLGVVMSRWNDFVTGKVGTGPEFATLRNNIGLLNTAMGRVHGGARGGASPLMLNHFKSMLGAGTMDAATLRSSLAVYEDWLGGYAKMAPIAGGVPGAGRIGGTDGAVPAGPKLNDTQSYNGDTYKFDGQVWRKQPK